MAFIDDLSSLLIAEGVASAVYLSTKALVPTGAGPYVQIIETGGTAGERIHNKVDGDAIEHPAAQVRVRALDYQVAYEKAKEAFRVIAAVRNRYLNGVFYLDLRPLQNVYDLSIDNTGRGQAGFNVLATKEPS